MRLTTGQRHIILTAVHELIGNDARACLFGSRLDDHAKGGDLDLLLLVATAPSRLAIAEFKQRLEAALFLPVDILFYIKGAEPTPFQAIALSQAQPIEVEAA